MLLLSDVAMNKKIFERRVLACNILFEVGGIMQPDPHRPSSSSRDSLTGRPAADCMFVII